MTSSSSVLDAQVQTATYDSALNVPHCMTISRGCSTGDLVLSRGTITDGNELNAPNTLDGCTDGDTGSYLQDESLERVVVESLSGDYITEGSSVKVTATANVFSTAIARISITPPAWMKWIGNILVESRLRQLLMASED